MKEASRDKRTTQGDKTVESRMGPLDQIGQRLRIAHALLQSLDRPVVEASLLLITGSQRPLPRAIGSQLIVGRSETAGWQIEDLALSRRHFEIRQSDLGCLLRDLDSHNGTRVNSLDTTERWLADGDIIRAGGQAFLYLASIDMAEKDPRP